MSIGHKNSLLTLALLSPQQAGLIFDSSQPIPFTVTRQSGVSILGWGPLIQLNNNRRNPPPILATSAIAVS
jgi:hypothetical protein